MSSPDPDGTTERELRNLPPTSEAFQRECGDPPDPAPLRGVDSVRAPTRWYRMTHATFPSYWYFVRPRRPGADVFARD